MSIIMYGKVLTEVNMFLGCMYLLMVSVHSIPIDVYSYLSVSLLGGLLRQEQPTCNATKMHLATPMANTFKIECYTSKTSDAIATAIDN